VIDRPIRPTRLGTLRSVVLSSDPPRWGVTSLSIRVRPLSLLVTLGAIAVGLVVAHYLGDVIGDGGDAGWRSQIARLTDLNDESSVGTWYSSVLLLTVAGVALLHAGQAVSSRRLKWGILGAVFVFLSIDEATSIHEAGDSLHDFLGIETATTFLWTVPYAIAVLFLAAGFYRFFLSLPRRTRKLFVLSAAIYLGGALGLELVAALSREFDLDSLVENVLIPIEEGMEMLGASVFIYTLLDLFPKDRQVAAQPPVGSASPTSKTFGRA